MQRRKFLQTTVAASVPIAVGGMHQTSELVGRGRGKARGRSSQPNRARQSSAK